MATVYERDGTDVLWCWGRDRQGKRWFRSTKQKDWPAARIAARAIEAAILVSADPARDKAEARAEQLTLEAAVRLMLEAAMRADSSPENIEFLTTKSRHLLTALGSEKRVAEINLATVTKYADKRLAEGAHRHTVQKEIRVLTQALRRAQKLGLLSGKLDPRSLMLDELKGAYVPRSRWLGHDDLDVLLSELGPSRHDYVIVIAWTGLRLKELYGLTPESCDVGANEIHVAGTKTKKSRRRIPLAPAAREAVLRRLRVTPRGKPLFPVWHTMGRDLDAATLRIEKRLNPGWERPQGRRGHGLGAVDGKAPQRNAKGRPPPKKGRVSPPIPFPSVTANDLRRTFASWLANSGVPLLQAAELMGHSSTKMLEEVYARLAPATLHSAIERMTGFRTVTGGVTAAPRSRALQPVQRGKRKPGKGSKTAVFAAPPG
jgi:integrase